MLLIKICNEIVMKICILLKSEWWTSVLALEIENVESYLDSLWEEKWKDKKLEYVSNLFLE